MEMAVVRFVLLMFIGCLSLATGSNLEFESSPDTVTLGLTRNLTLRCALSDTVDQSNASIPIIGRRRREVKGQAAAAPVASPGVNTQHVNSMVVIKIGDQNKTLASIIAGSSATAYVNVEDVQGQILSQAGERAFLELTWSRPGADLGGMYECRVSALDEFGFPISYVQEIQVNMGEPNILQLVDRLWELETMDQLLQTQLLQSESELNVAKQQISSLMSTVATLSPAHAEQGKIYCEPWIAADIYINKTETYGYQYNADEFRQSLHQIVFQRPYSSVPAIIISTTMMHDLNLVTTSGSAANIGGIYQISAENITTQGFTIRCATRYDTGADVIHMGINWLSTVME